MAESNVIPLFAEHTGLRNARIVLREYPLTDPIALDALDVLEWHGDDRDRAKAAQYRIYVAAALAESVNRDFRHARRRYRLTVAAAFALAFVWAALIANVPAAVVAALMTAQQEIEQ